MKKTISRTVLAILLCAGVAVLIAVLLSNFVLTKGPAELTEYEKNLAQLRPDNDAYIDYAKEVKFDLDRDPELVNQGLFWVQFDEDGNFIKTKADTKEAADVVDTDKPTIVLIHGMKRDGNVKLEDYDILKYHLDWDKFGIDSSSSDLPPYFNMAYLWWKKGWNVAFYQCERFVTASEYWSLEQKMWTWVEHEEDENGVYNNGFGTSYIKTNGDEVRDAIKYGVSEHFVAEYIRAMKMLPESMGNKEIRFTAHSMGGQVTAPALFLLHELARDEIGQLPKRCLPDRYTLMDTFFSVYLEDLDKNTTANLFSDMTVGPFNIGWSGKPFIKNTTGHTIAFILEYLNKQGMALEYYTEPGSFLYNTLAYDVLDAIHKYCSVVIIDPDWDEAQPGYNKLFDSHNGVREWYMCSLTTSQPVDEDGNFVPNARMSTEDVIKNHGKFFYQVGGIQDINTYNDVFEIREKNYGQIAREEWARKKAEEEPIE